MFFAPFFIEFPDIAMNQTRVVTVFDHKNDLPVGKYGFINAYCTDETCDCRRVMINVIAHQQKPNDPPLAVLSYGWEPESFYRKWSPHMPDDTEYTPTSVGSVLLSRTVLLQGFRQ